MNTFPFWEFEDPEEWLPQIVIVGRPNVGKSTLFNRLIGQRKAIVDPTPGVTRDPVTHPVCWEGIPALLVDTGGYRSDFGGLDALVSKKSLECLQGADCIVWVTEVGFVSAEDEVLLQALRPYVSKTVLAVNKVDNDLREAEVWNFYQYGIPTVVPISASHGSNITELTEAVVTCLRQNACAKVDAAKERWEQQAAPAGPAADGAGSAPDAGGAARSPSEAPPIRLLVLGQPNTGKSTLCNRLIGEERSLVSDIPGTTRDRVEGSFVRNRRRFFIVDTAGIRRKKRVGENIEYYSVNRAIAGMNDCDVVLLMMDAQKGLTEQDKKIANLAVKAGRALILVMNKWDLLTPLPNQEEAVRDRIHFLFPIVSFAPLIPLSALTDEGIPRLLREVETVYAQWTRRTETHRLNQGLTQWLFDHQPPSQSGMSFKPKYLVQTSTAPPRFLLFVNRVKGFPEAWLTYLKNRLRTDCGYGKVPVEVHIKSGSPAAELRPGAPLASSGKRPLLKTASHRPLPVRASGAGRLSPGKASPKRKVKPAAGGTSGLARSRKPRRKQ